MSKTFIRYVASGLSAVAVEYSLFVLLLSTSMTLLLANAFSFGAGLVTSFMLNRMWSFNKPADYDRRGRQQFGLYVGLALCNLVVSSLIVSLLVRNDASPLVAKCFSIAVIASYNYVLFKYFIFKTTRPSQT